jgi:hypothetical protein
MSRRVFVEPFSSSPTPPRRKQKINREQNLNFNSNEQVSFSFVSF